MDICPTKHLHPRQPPITHHLGQSDQISIELKITNLLINKPQLKLTYDAT